MTGEVTVLGPDRQVISQHEITSGGMTPEQKALGSPQSTLVTHAEYKATTQIPLSKGDVMVINGDRLCV
jgi:hypothetical protein